MAGYPLPGKPALSAPHSILRAPAAARGRAAANGFFPTIPDFARDHVGQPCHDLGVPSGSPEPQAARYRLPTHGDFLLRVRWRAVGCSWELVANTGTSHTDTRVTGGWAPNVTVAKLRAARAIERRCRPDAGILEFTGEQVVEFAREWVEPAPIGER